VAIGKKKLQFLDAENAMRLKPNEHHCPEEFNSIHTNREKVNKVNKPTKKKGIRRRGRKRLKRILKSRGPLNPGGKKGETKGREMGEDWG